MTGRLPDSVAAPAWQGLLALVPAGPPSGPALAALEMAARALVARVEWGRAPVGSDWEAAQEQTGSWLFREGTLLSVQGAPGRPRQLVLARPDGPVFTVSWAADGSWVAGRPGEETWAGLASGAVISQEDLLGRSLEGLDRLEEGGDRAEEAALPQDVPRGELGPARLWGETDQEEAAWTGDMVAPGLSVGALTSLVAGLATRVAARAGQAVSTADVGRAAHAGPPAKSARAPGSAACACGAPRVPGARFCPRCGTPAPVACSRCGVVGVPGARFCKACGAAVAPHTCPRCQAPLSRDLRSCPRCGAPMAVPPEPGA